MIFVPKVCILLAIYSYTCYSSLTILQKYYNTNIESKEESIMTDLQETKIGLDMLGKELPKLIHELKRIANALEKPAQGFAGMSVEDSNDFLEDFYYGNLEPANEITGEDLRTNLEQIIALQDTLCSKLTGEQWELYEQLQVLCEKRHSRETELGFYTGFRMAMQMVMAGMAPIGSAGPANGNPGRQ